MYEGHVKISAVFTCCYEYNVTFCFSYGVLENEKPTGAWISGKRVLGYLVIQLMI